MSQRAWTNSARRLRLASESRSWAWSDFFLNGIPSAAAPATGAGCCSQGQTFSATPPAVRLRSHPHGRVATRPAVARQSGVWDQAGNSLSRSAQCASAPRKSSKPSPGSRRSARPTRPGYPCPGRRPPVASAANHPNKVAPSSCARKVAIATIHHREKCSSGIFFYPLMENRVGLKYLAWPTRRIQSISSGVNGPLSKASSAAARSEADLGPVRQRSTTSRQNEVVMRCDFGECNKQVSRNSLLNELHVLKPLKTILFRRFPKHRPEPQSSPEGPILWSRGRTHKFRS